jgi:hypothetical protein
MSLRELERTRAAKRELATLSWLGQRPSFCDCTLWCRLDEEEDPEEVVVSDSE